MVFDSGELHQQQPAGSQSLFNHQTTVWTSRQVCSDSFSSATGTFALPAYIGLLCVQSVASV